MNNRKLITLALCAAFIGVCAITAAAAERNVPRTAWTEARLTTAATLHAGQVVGQTGGLAYPFVSTSTNLTVVGVAQNSVASNGIVRVRSGLFGLKNLGTVTASHIGGYAYAATNNTAWTVAPSGTAAVGKIVNVDDSYVWVRCGP